MRTLVVVPTYNEAENIEQFVRAVRKAAPAVDLLVVDDSSPDGSADIAEQVGEDIGQIQVLRRGQKDGLGNAYRQGFSVAIDAGYEVLVTIDADFSFDPAAIPLLLEAVEAGADLAVGSRYVPGGSTPDWPAHRRWLSRYGNSYSGWILGLKMRDATSGFRAYRATLLQEVAFETTAANGYAFMTELGYRISTANASVVEVPIAFSDRRRGTSKMSTTIIVESMARVTWWGLKLRLNRLRGRRRPSAV